MAHDRSSSSRNTGRRIGRRIAPSIALVAALGLIAFLAVDGASYWADTPEACLRCHVMQPQHTSWQASSHAFVAVCNDCHTPAHPVAKALTKARSGLAHAWAFSTGRYSRQIRIAPASAGIALDACRRCHAEMAESMGHGGVAREDRNCLDCHRRVGHADSQSTF